MTNFLKFIFLGSFYTSLSFYILFFALIFDEKLFITSYTQAILSSFILFYFISVLFWTTCALLIYFLEKYKFKNEISKSYHFSLLIISLFLFLLLLLIKFIFLDFIQYKWILLFIIPLFFFAFVLSSFQKNNYVNLRRTKELGPDL